MNERTIFAEALERDIPAQRSQYLDAACGGDPSLRQRVEALLESHEQAGSFLGKPVPERLAEELLAADAALARQGENAGEDLGFLDPSDQPGSLGRLGSYEITRVIGRGGMGIVLEGRDTRLDRVVAVKVLAPQLAVGAAARQRFLREARAAAAVRDEHVVTIYAVEEANGLPYLVMELIAGMSLQERIDRDGPLELKEILRIGIQAARGLAAAHGQGLIHRDVKPANILLENGVERVKITDFGLARVADDASITQSGVIAGTPQYMAPEQARGESVDHRTDLFSLGSVLYAMCTGRPPFRAGTTMGVLKRVCDDQVSPIREANPSIPDWLVALIDRLHAKDPAERNQSAAEVADLLSRRLADVQHPSVVGQVSNLSGHAGHGWKPAPGRHRWALAAAALLCLSVGLGVTEATGVTEVVPTVVRIVTGEGALVVELNDAGAKVTVEGNGDLVITGRGLDEFRLRPGSYRVRADKDGKPIPLETDLVTICRNERQVVRVRLEAAVSTPGASAVESGAFVVLSNAGIEVRKCDTLAEAVLGASNGDTIEVRGNGPFMSAAIQNIHNRLAIRAGVGFRPVIWLSDEHLDSNLLQSYAPLTLEGLELRRPPPKQKWPNLVACHAAPLYVANCRIVAPGVTGLGGYQVGTCHVRNCEFFGPSSASLAVTVGTKEHWFIDNCLHVTTGVVILCHQVPDEPASIVLTRNTVLRNAALFDIHLPSHESARYLTIDASGNVLDVKHMAWLWFPASPTDGDKQVSLSNLLRYRGEQNVYDMQGQYWGAAQVKARQPVKVAPCNSLAEWSQLWPAMESGSAEGGVRYQGGDLRSKTMTGPGCVFPGDFQLRTDSAGYRAGPDGKDLGADIDLVGPGAAYERWKRTPEYQEWLKETGQVK